MRPSSSRSEPEASSSPYGGLLGGLPGDPPVDAVVGDRSLVSAMLRAEAALAAAPATVGLAPATAARVIGQVAGSRDYDAGELGAAAAASGNPVVPLAAWLTRDVAAQDEGAARYVHRGATSQDILDTALMLVADEAATRTLHLLDCCASTPRAPRDWARVNAHGRPHAGPARGAHDVRAHGDRVAHRHRRGHRAAAREPVAARRPARRPGRDRRGVEPAAARAAGGLCGRDGAAGRHPVAHRPQPGRRAGGGARAGRDRVREDRHRRGGVVPERDRRAARGGGARPRRILGHAAQAEPGGSGADPVGGGARPRARRHGAVGRGARGPAGDRRLARRVVTAARAAAPRGWRDVP